NSDYKFSHFLYLEKIDAKISFFLVFSKIYGFNSLTLRSLKNKEETMLAKIEQLLQEIEGLQAANAEELEALRIKYLSKKGAINELMAD
ncbi:hypothetical protein, partial [Aeromicrobium sp. MLTX1]|uniref:hypothetical protein n=1 Tax=Aeromicrobium sp. MLTX1 TaxID=3389799 RepID=UPI00396B2C6A